LVSLPSLPNTLQELDCSCNQLVKLPQLPNSLKILVCYHNKLVSIPLLPNLLFYLNVRNNQIVYLPQLPNSLKMLIGVNNPIYKFIRPYPYSLNISKKQIIILGKFRDLYYCIKYKEHFRKWLWGLRENKVKEEFQPDR